MASSSAQQSLLDMFEYVDVNDELTCVICMDPFDDPIELKPCGHLFCTKCIAPLRECPTCRGSIASRVAPNRVIKNMAEEVATKCKRCTWRGPRAARASHAASCSGGRPTPATTSVASASGASASGVAPIPATRPVPAGSGGYGAAAQQSYAMQQQQQHAAGGFYTPQPLQQQASWTQQPPVQMQPQPQPYQQPQQGYQQFQPPAGYYQQQQQQQPYQQQQQQQQQQQAYQQQQQQQQPPRRFSSGPPPALIASHSHPRPWELYALTQEEYDQIVAIFMTFDEDDSGELDRGELEKLARWLNFAQQPGEIDKMFRDMDTDKSGSLTLEEFCTWHKYHKPDPQALYGLRQADYNVVLMQFRSYDSNHDGALSLPEFQRLCQQMHFYRTPQEAAQVFAQIDLDRNGTVDLHEFLMFRSAAARSQQSSYPQQQGCQPVVMPQQQQPHNGSYPYGGGGGYQQHPPPRV